jgi:hypothetical protein
MIDQTPPDEPSLPPEVDMEAVRRAGARHREGTRAIGNFMFEFSQLEFTVRAVLQGRLKIEKEFFDIVIGPYDFRILCAVTMRVSCIRFPERTDELKKLFNECQTLNDKRVHIAHGVWTEGEEGFSLRFFNRQRLEADFVDYSADDLNRLAEKAQDLMQRVLGFQSKV